MFQTNYLGVPFKVSFDHYTFYDNDSPTPVRHATEARIEIKINRSWVKISDGISIVHPNDFQHGQWSKAKGRKIALARALKSSDQYCRSKLFRSHIWAEYFKKIGKVA